MVGWRLCMHTCVNVPVCMLHFNTNEHVNCKGVCVCVCMCVQVCVCVCMCECE